MSLCVTLFTCSLSVSLCFVSLCAHVTSHTPQTYLLHSLTLAHIQRTLHAPHMRKHTSAFFPLDRCRPTAWYPRNVVSSAAHLAFNKHVQSHTPHTYKHIRVGLSTHATPFTHATHTLRSSLSPVHIQHTHKDAGYTYAHTIHTHTHKHTDTFLQPSLSTGAAQSRCLLSPTRVKREIGGSSRLG